MAKLAERIGVKSMILFGTVLKAFLLTTLLWLGLYVVNDSVFFISFCVVDGMIAITTIHDLFVFVMSQITENALSNEF